MAVGWAKDGAVQDQIDATVSDAVALARSRISHGESLSHCEECGNDIPEARQQAIPGVHLCVQCQSELDRRYRVTTAGEVKTANLGNWLT